MVAREKVGGKRQGIWNGHVHTAICKMDNQQGPTIYHIELCSCYVAAWMGEDFEGEWVHV